MSGVAWAEPAPDESLPPVVVRAEYAQFKDGWLEVSGPLSIDMGTEQLEGEGLRYQPETGHLELRSGTWTSQGRVLRFEEAQLMLGAQTGTLLQAALESSEIRVKGEEIRVLGPGTLEGQGVQISPCTCENELWGVRAESATIQLNEEVEFRGGWVQICERSVLPIPRGKLPLQPRKSGLLLPEVAWGQEGPQASIPVFWALSPHADILIEPEFRAERGARLLTEGRVGLGTTGPLIMGASAGWDVTESAWRGHASAVGGTSQGRWEGAVDSLWMSDPDVRLDYEDDYMLRAVPWVEQRASLSWGAARLETEQSLEDDVQRILGGVVAFPGVRLGDVSVNAESRVDLFSNREEGSIQSPDLRAEGRLGLTRGAQVGVLQLEGRTSLTGVAWQGESPWGGLVAGGGAWLPTWGEGRQYTRLDQWGMIARVSQTTAEYALRHPWDQTAPDWVVGPALRSRWITPSGVPISVGLELPYTPHGLEPFGRLRLSHGPWVSRFQGSTALQELQVGWQDSVWGVGAGVVHTEELWQANGGVDTPPVGGRKGLRLGWHGLFDLETLKSVSQGPVLTYSSDCDCLDLRLQALWSEDRIYPDVGLQLELQ